MRHACSVPRSELVTAINAHSYSVICHGNFSKSMSHYASRYNTDKNR